MIGALLLRFMLSGSMRLVRRPMGTSLTFSGRLAFSKDETGLWF